jgi:hypothetical protein
LTAPATEAEVAVRAVAAPVVAVGASATAVVVKEAMVPLVVPVAFWATAWK